MKNKEIEKLLSCDNCKLKECIQCEISYTDKKKIREYIEQTESEASASNQVHEYDMKMIDDVKGECVQLYKENEKLKEKIKELNKGQHTLMQSRRKWKNRYYKEKMKNVSITNKKEMV